MIRKLTLALAASAALFVIAAAHPSAALANFKVCNDSGENIDVAIAYHDAESSNWVARGWWNLDNGECKTPIGGDLKDQYYYLYANGTAHSWTGPHDFCVDTTSAFTLNEADTTCDYNYKSFFEIDTGESSSYTYTFN